MLALRFEGRREAVEQNLDPLECNQGQFSRFCHEWIRNNQVYRRQV